MRVHELIHGLSFMADGWVQAQTRYVWLGSHDTTEKFSQCWQCSWHHSDDATSRASSGKRWREQSTCDWNSGAVPIKMTISISGNLLLASIKQSAKLLAQNFCTSALVLETSDFNTPLMSQRTCAASDEKRFVPRPVNYEPCHSQTVCGCYGWQNK